MSGVHFASHQCLSDLKRRKTTLSQNEWRTQLQISDFYLTFIWMMKGSFERMQITQIKICYEFEIVKLLFFIYIVGIEQWQQTANK